MTDSSLPEINLTNFIAFSIEKRDEFNRLSVEEMEKFLRDENLVVTREDEAFQSLQRWLIHSPADRYPAVPKLLPLIRLNQLVSSYLSTTVKAIAIEGKCEPLITSGLQRHRLSLGEREKFAVAYCTEPRKTATQIYIYAVSSAINGHFSTFANTWTEDDRHRFDYLHRCYSQYGAYEMVIFHEDAFKIFNFRKQDVRELETPPAFCVFDRDELAIEVVGDDLYVFGVSYDNVVCGRFNFTSGQWMKMAMMQQRHQGICTAVLNGKIYVVGEMMECYDPTTDTWSVKMYFDRHLWGKMVAFQHYLFWFGDNGQKTIERYDSHKNEWSVIARFEDEMRGFSVINVNGLAYIIGNGDTGSRKRYPVFDLNTRQFTGDTLPHVEDLENPCLGYYMIK